ncbi:MAG: hypothetical protein KZQ96_23320 [Candidatus Thiodiazotropha sp. (ex Lucinoma borealis)]|nr:hypothetical protein [Candidatus Thiodiazotropha sp. (ex Lucinoma borealis)]
MAILAGDWYDSTAGLIRRHYLPVIERTLETVAQTPGTGNWSDPLLRLTHGWPFPKPYRNLHPDEDQDLLDTLQETITTTRGQSDLAKRILDTFIAERDHLPKNTMDTLCTWVRGFGTLDEPVAQPPSLVKGSKENSARVATDDRSGQVCR